jgi:hypothetical protein
MAQPSDLQIEIAAAAARLIAEDGLDYASAKRKAAHEVLGEGARQTLPDNAVVELELLVATVQLVVVVQTQVLEVLEV